MESVPSYAKGALTALPTFGSAALSKLEACLLDALPACVALVDHGGTVVFVNRAWTRFAEENGGLGRRDVVETRYLDPGFWTANTDEPPDDVVRACAGASATPPTRRAASTGSSCGSTRCRSRTATAR
jgi:hypothetical protein